MTDTPEATADPGTQVASWVDLYGDDLYRYAVLRVHDHQVAEDLVQDTFVAAFKGLDRFEGRSTPRTWLTSILKHKIVDFIRKDVRSRPVADPEPEPEATDRLFDETGHWAVAPSRWQLSPSQVMERKQFMQALQDCLGQIKPRLAQAFTLREIDGLSTEEVCDILGISANNSWVMLYRARMALRRCLELHYQEE